MLVFVFVALSVKLLLNISLKKDPALYDAML